MKTWIKNVLSLLGGLSVVYLAGFLLGPLPWAITRLVILLLIVVIVIIAVEDWFSRKMEKGANRKKIWIKSVLIGVGVGIAAYLVDFLTGLIPWTVPVIVVIGGLIIAALYSWQAKKDRMLNRN